MNIRNHKFEDRFSPICSIEGEPGPSGGDGGGGGGGSGGDAGSATTSGAEALPGGGGAQPADAPHYFPNQPSPGDAGRVRNVLDMESDPDHRLTTDDIRVLLGWNPPMGKKEQPKTGAPDGQQQPQQTPAAAANPGEQQPATQQPAPGAEPALDPNLKALVEKLDQLASTPAPAGQQQTQQPQAQEGPKDFYGTVVPEVQVAPQLVEALLNADNPQQAHQAMNVLVKGIMNRVMHDASRLMLAQQQRMMQVLPEIVKTHHAGSSNTEKFYSKYQELNKPGLQPLVNQAAIKLAQDYAAKGKALEFNDDTMKAIADMVHSAVEGQFGISLRPKVAPAPAQNPQNPPPVKPNGKANGTFFTPNGARPPAASGGPSGQSADLRNFVL